MPEGVAAEILYVGRDEAFAGGLGRVLVHEGCALDDFVSRGMAFSMLPAAGYSVIIVDGEYSDPLTLIETIRVSYSGGLAPYILLASPPDRLDSFKSRLSIRNYPDDIVSKTAEGIYHLSHIRLGLARVRENRAIAGVAEGDIIRGNLRDRGFGSLLYGLHRRRFSGKLIIESPPEKAVFTFVSGQPAEAVFHSMRFTLGRMLLRKGVIDETAYRQMMEMMKRSGIRLGEALIRSGLLGARDVMELTREQFREKLLYFFARDRGEYLVVSGAADQLLPFHGAPDLFELVCEGVMRHATDDYLRSKYGVLNDRYIAITENFPLQVERLSLNQAERRLIEAIRDCPRVSELAAQSLDPLGVYRVLEILDCCDMCSFNEQLDEAVGRTETADVETAELGEAIIKDYVSMGEKNHYEILGLSRNVESQELKRQYHEMVKLYHPDTFFSMPLGDELMTMVHEIFVRIQTAYRTLSDEASRRAYDEALFADDDGVERESDCMNAELAFKAGETRFRERNYADAEARFREAVMYNNLEPDYLLSLATAIMSLRQHLTAERNAEIQALLDRVLFLDPRSDRACHLFGLWHRLNGRSGDAIAWFRNALSLNPKNKDAEAELKRDETD